MLACICARVTIRTLALVPIKRSHWLADIQQKDSLFCKAIFTIIFVLKKNPEHLVFPNTITFSDEQRKIVEAEIYKLERIGAIVQSSHEPQEFISNLFIVPKLNGKFRPVLNL